MDVIGQRYEVLINAGVGCGTLLGVVLSGIAAGVAAWAALAASRAVDEAKAMRFADNLPLLLIEAAADPDHSIKVKNRGKGPATILSLWLQIGKEPHVLRKSQRYFIAPSGEVRYPWYVFNVFAQECTGDPTMDFRAMIAARRKDYIPKTEGQESKSIEGFLQYEDLFGNKFAQHFYYYPIEKQVVMGQFRMIGEENRGLPRCQVR